MYIASMGKVNGKISIRSNSASLRLLSVKFVSAKRPIVVLGMSRIPRHKAESTPFTWNL